MSNISSGDWVVKWMGKDNGKKALAISVKTNGAGNELVEVLIAGETKTKHWPAQYVYILETGDDNERN